MSELFEKSIRTLELPAVLEKLAAKAVSQAAKDRCLKLTPSTDVEEVLRLLDETDAAKERLGLHGSPSFSGVKDVSAALTRADHGGMLNTRELLDIAGVLTASRRVSDYDAQRQGEETVLDRLFTSLHTNKYLEEQIRSAILDEETIADINRQLSGIETILLFTEPELTSISSSVVRELLSFGKDVSRFLPEGMKL